MIYYLILVFLLLLFSCPFIEGQQSATVYSDGQSLVVPSNMTVNGVDIVSKFIEMTNLISSLQAEIAALQPITPRFFYFSASSGSYTVSTVPRKPAYLKVRLVGGGGGGGGSGVGCGSAASGTDGGASTFLGSGVALTANGGKGGTCTIGVSSGGTSFIVYTTNVTGNFYYGGSGQGNGYTGSNSVNLPGGNGGNSFFGGNGGGASSGDGNGGTGWAASGGGGGACAGQSACYIGGGGGGGGYIEAIVINLDISYSWTTGSGGTGGPLAGAGGSVGGNGGNGFVEITEYFQ